MNILVFPCNTFEALCYAKQMKAAGHSVYGASSVKSEYTLKNVYSHVSNIPHISDIDFKGTLSETLSKFEINGFWTSIESVYRIVNQVIENASTISLSSNPTERSNTVDSILTTELDERVAYLEVLSTQYKGIENKSLLCSIIKNTMAIPGESHLDKLLTICSIYSSVPKNADIVEIGCLFGRTARLFNLLNKRYETGNLLCIDPWPKSGGATQNVHESLEICSQEFDGDRYFSTFCTGLMAEGQNTISYIRDFSENAISKYETIDECLTTEEFGKTIFNKRIGLLHVDGNHCYEDVVNDIQNYVSKVVQGGWIVFDDYNWQYGEGVKQAVNEYLELNTATIKTAFFSGGALFVQLK